MKVLCKLKNASELINGVKFEATDAGMLSESVDAEVAAQFKGIPGYELFEEGDPEGAEQPSLKTKHRKSMSDKAEPETH